MLSDAHLLTPPTNVALYKPQDVPSTTKSLISSSVFLLHIDRSLTRREEQQQSELQIQAQEPMDDNRPRSRSRSRQRAADESELWFSMPSGLRSEREHEPQPQDQQHQHQHQQHQLLQEQSAYRATQTRHTASTNSSLLNLTPSTSLRDTPASTTMSANIPAISTTADLNKPLPQPGGHKKRKPASLRSLLRRQPEDRQLDSTHLAPESFNHRQRHSSDNNRLKPDSYQHAHYHQHSRSMPSSPLGLAFNQYSQPTVESARAASVAGDFNDSNEYRPYSMNTAARSVSVNTYFDQTPPRARTFPDSGTTVTPTPRESVSNRPRPHTWLSPTEPFEDASQFHLFVEATSGLVDDVDPFQNTTSPRLQGSLFARRRENDVIPLPLQNPEALDSFQSHQVSGWQNLDYEYYDRPDSSHSPTSSIFPRADPAQQSNLGPHLNAINLELERLGISEENAPEDELPDYAQSQAEMHAKKRAEATKRARELEARWKNARGRSRS